MSGAGSNWIGDSTGGTTITLQNLEKLFGFDALVDSSGTYFKTLQLYTNKCAQVCQTSFSWSAMAVVGSITESFSTDSAIAASNLIKNSSPTGVVKDVDFSFSLTTAKQFSFTPITLTSVGTYTFGVSALAYTDPSTLMYC